MVKFIKESKIIQLQNPNIDFTSMIKVIQNPTKIQLENIMQEDKYHTLRCFLTDKDLYCWKGFALTHEEAKNALLNQEGLEINPLCGIAIDGEGIHIANSWNKVQISQENKEKILHHPQLQYLFGNNYTIIDL